MDLQCECTSCGAILLVERQHLGCLVECPACSARFVLNEPEATEASSAVVQEPAAEPQAAASPLASTSPAPTPPVAPSEVAVEPPVATPPMETPTVAAPSAETPLAETSPTEEEWVAMPAETAETVAESTAPPAAPSATAAAETVAAPAAPARGKQCPECDMQLLPGNSKCPECGYDVDLIGIGLGDELPRFIAKDLRRTRVRPAAARQRKKWFAVVTGTVGAVVLLAAVGLGFFAVLRDRGAGTSTPKVPKRTSTLALDWPVEERFTGRVSIDGVAKGVPASGSQQIPYSLAPGKHRLVVRRESFKPIEMDVELGEAETFRLRPDWMLAPLGGAEPTPPGGAGGVGDAKAPPAPAPAPVAPQLAKPAPESAGADLTPSFDDWLQDLEQAKTKAAAEKKDILIAFDGSDWCGWSIRLAFEVFFQREFRDRVKDEYVLVIVDFPRKREARAKVQNPARNTGLAKRFRVRGYPTIVLTDAQARPYGFGGYVEGGVSRFLESLGALRQVRQERDKLLYDVDRAEGEAKLTPIQEALKFFREHRLAGYYGPTLNEWLALVRQFDPKNEKGVHEAVFEATWLVRWAEAAQQGPQALQMAAELDEWKKAHEFKDADRAARLHLYAATSLALADQTASASKYVEAGLAYKPKDKDLLEQLNEARVGIRGVGSGTGFVVAPGGCVLTNHHVIKGPGKILVQVPGQKDPLPADVRAQDADQDLALLKVKLPGTLQLKPIPLSSVSLSRGAKVGAFGFAVSGMVGSGLKLTTGVVSSMADQSTQGMLLLDCRVNPGNSGGPLCDTQGNVVGMVTAKSFSGFGIESYGMAMPAEVLRAFLAKHLPEFAKQPAAPVETKPLEWDEIDRRVGSSVLMIIRSR